MQEALFYSLSLERHVPNDHLLRKIDRFVDLSEEPYGAELGRPSIDPADDPDADRRLLLRHPL